MNIYMYIHAYIHVHTYMYIHTCTYIHPYIHAYIHVHTYPHTLTHVHTGKRTPDNIVSGAINLEVSSVVSGEFLIAPYHTMYSLLHEVSHVV